MTPFLVPLLFLLISAVIIPEGYFALKTGQLRLRGGGMLKKEENVSRFWLTIALYATVAVFLLCAGLMGFFSAIRQFTGKS